MEFLDNERGQAVQVGAILLFGFLVIGLSLYQATVVPQETKSVEFEAYLDASDDLVSLHNDILASATRGVQSGTSVQTGIQYPPRVLFVNPGPSTGSLALSESHPITIAGAEAVDGEPESVEALWNGSARTYESKVLRYSPGYNEFDGTPVSITGSTVQRETETRVVPLGGQTLISGNRITVISLDGQIGQTSTQTALTVAPISSATRTVTVTNTSDGDITLTVPVGTNATAWTRSTTADRMMENARVESITDLDDATDSTNTLARVVLNGSYTYELRLAKVELSSSSAASTVGSPPAEYLVPVTTGAVASRGDSAEVVVEARDAYNNPVEGESIEFTVSGNASPASRTITTTDEGRATFEFTVNDGATGNISIEATNDFDDSGDIDPIREQVTYSVPLVSGDGTGTGDGSTGEINPPNNRIGDVILEDVTTDSKTSVEVQLNNTGDLRNITQFRVSFYYPDQGSPIAETVTFNGSDPQRIGGLQYELGADSVEMNSNTTVPVELVFDDNDDAGDGNKMDVNSDFFILTVRFDTGESATYFVAVPK
ncbi:Ig-like domain-containing protein [Haloferax sp. DFSO60]|uniref:Ig-like domain-containing protein n=1 Tax=Haloferax sp. DFSO60 TaxID=3388652 RepID=UPI00397C1AC9